MGHLKKNRGIIFHTTLKVTLFKTNQDGEDESRPVYIRGKNRRMLDISEFEDLYEESKNKIWLTFDEWLKDGSGQGGIKFKISWEPSFPVNYFARNNGMN